MTLINPKEDLKFTPYLAVNEEEKSIPPLPILRYHFLDQRRHNTAPALLDSVAHMLLYLDQPDIVLEVALAYLVRTLAACRGDAGVGTPQLPFYIPTAVYLDSTRAAPTMLGIHVPNQHPALQAVWQSAVPVRFEQVEINPLIGNLREAFIELRSRSMVARRLEQKMSIFGVICIDHTEESHEWQPAELQLIEDFCQEFLSPLLVYSLRLYRQNNPSASLLTPAELEVIRLAANGFTYSRIAQVLGKSVHTVDKQLRSAREKTGARNQTELIRLTSHLL
jgi:DNA-binding CsgD family transcriptional regulator